jgi:uncharacterized protein DUF1566
VRAPLEYVDNGDGTVTDMNTGLMWEKKSDDGSVHDKDASYGLTTGLGNPLATELLNALNGRAFGDFTDWRLPTVEELFDLEDCRQSTHPDTFPAFDNNCLAGCDVQGCSCTAVDDPYWSSSGCGTDAIHGQPVPFAPEDFGLFKARAHHVRAVRGPARQPRFIDHNDGTVTDTQTGLLWERKSNDSSVHNSAAEFSWSRGGPPFLPDGTVFTQFVDVLNGQAFAGHSDWRLPTLPELESLAYDRNGCPPLIDPAFGNCCLNPSCSETACDCIFHYNFWTSTSTQDDTAAVEFNFFDGTSFPWDKTQLLSARAVRGAPAAPPNDACSSATVITALPFTETRVTLAATTSPDDPVQSCAGGRAHGAQSVWYRFTASAAGPFVVDTAGSTYDTVLSAYTGTCGALAEVACNDDAGETTVQSKLSLAAESGQTVLIETTAFDPGTSGTLTLNVSPASHAPVNDACSGATEITAFPFTDTILTSEATTALDDPLQSCTSGGPVRNSNSVWYRVTAPAEGTLVARTVGSDYDTVLTAYTGTCAQLVETECNDDVAASTQSEASVPVTTGQTVLLEVTQFDGLGGGTLVFTVSAASPATRSARSE